MRPKFWQFQTPSTDIMIEIIELYYQVMILMGLIVGLVFGLICYMSYKFYYKRNPIPSKFNSSIKLEILWTVIPTIIICMIAVPSIQLIKKINTTPEAEFTIKVTGHQWFWSYKYINHQNIEFDSRMLGDEDNWDLNITNSSFSKILEENDLDPQINSNEATFFKEMPTNTKVRLLEVDNRMVIPVNKIVRLIFTSGDVIHSFTIPSAGLKMDCIPGKITETWLKINKIGVYRGQCSELCGANHGFMPIVVEVVSGEDFLLWINNKMIE